MTDNKKFVAVFKYKRYDGSASVSFYSESSCSKITEEFKTKMTSGSFIVIKDKDSQFFVINTNEIVSFGLAEVK